MSYKRKRRTQPQRKWAGRIPGQPRRVRPRYTRSYGQQKELKFHDVDANDVVVAAGCNVLTAASINLIAEGTGESERIGRKCTITGIGLRYQVSLPPIATSAAISNGDTCRVILYLDKQANGATAVNTDILATNSFRSFRNLTNTSRFQVLLDTTHDLNYSTLTNHHTGAFFAQAGVEENYTFFKKCIVPLEFSANTGAITELRSNNLNLMICSENGTCGFTSKVRLRFTG